MADERSSLIQHAERELKLAGLDQPDADYGGMLAPAVMELITTFSDQGHSGQSAMIVATLFARLVQWRPLSPLTDDPDEWLEVSKEMLTKAEIKEGKRIWQSKRAPACFSRDGGKTYKDSEENQFYTSIDHKEAERERNEINKAEADQKDQGLSRRAGNLAPGSAAEDGQGLQNKPVSQPGHKASASEGGQSGAMEKRERSLSGAKPTDNDQPPQSSTQKGTPGSKTGKKSRTKGGA